MTKTLKQLILNKVEAEYGLTSKIAQQIGYSSGSALSKVLGDEKKEFEKFFALVKMVSILFPLEEVELMSDYALTLDINKRTARFMLEYLDQNRNTEVKRGLTRKMLTSKNVASREWAELYSIDDEYLANKITVSEALNRYGCLKSNSVEVQVGAKIFKAYCLLDEQAFGMLDEELLGLDMAIMRINEDYIREMYYSRYMILTIASKVAKSRMEEAREAANSILYTVTNSYYRALAYLHLGNSYLMESFEKANEIYNKGLAIATDKRCETVRDNLQRSSNFLHNLYGKTPKYLNIFSKHPADLHEVIFYYIKHKQYFKAKELLNEINFDQLNDVQKAFNLYYRGLMGDSVKNFSRSIVYFKKAGEYHFRKFPLLELERLGIDADLIEALSV